LSRRQTRKQTAQPKGPNYRRLVWRRTFIHLAISVGILGVSLVIGIAGYAYFEKLAWRDAFLNAAMILGGMGPVDTELTPSGKIFAGLYALYSGLIVVAIAGLLLGPGVHHLMHHVQWDDEERK